MITEQHTESVSAKKRRTSHKQLAANRANALHSTGPRTLSGKQRSALNALKHGVLAMRPVNATIDGKGDFDRFSAHRERYFDTLCPEDQLQADLVEQIAANRWRMGKLIEFEGQSAWQVWNKLVHEVRDSQYGHSREPELDMLEEAGLNNPTLPGEKESNLTLRYRASLNNEYFRALAELRRLKKEHATGEGVYSVTSEEDESASDDGINSVATKEDCETKPSAESTKQSQHFSATDKTPPEMGQGAGGVSDPEIGSAPAPSAPRAD